VNVERNPERCILINGEINGEVANGVMADLLEMECESDEDIVVRISSLGGETGFGLAIYDALRLSRCNIVTEAFGEVYSSAFLIFQAGDLRLVAPNSRLMWHDGTLGLHAALTPRELTAASRELQQLDDMCNQAVAKRTGVPLKVIEGWSREETYWTAKEAVANKLADEVLS
jgi:ATP-dependent Clp endopeptidase proteolytic subunit ClpP